MMISVKKKDGIRDSIEINCLDMSIICTILALPELTSIRRCCNQCEHECTRCTGNCSRSGDCNYERCKNCKNNCNHLKFLLFAIICRALRKTNADITAEKCSKFEEKVIKFENFPDSDDWSKIWNVVYEAALVCLNVLKVLDYIDEDTYEDFKMNLRIANKDPNFLIPIVGSYIDNFRRLIIGEEEMTEHLKNVEKCLINKGKLRFFTA